MRTFGLVSIASLAVVTSAAIAFGLPVLVAKPVPKPEKVTWTGFVLDTLRPYDPNRPELYKTVTAGIKGDKFAIASVPVRSVSIRPMPEENDEAAGDIASEELKEFGADLVKIASGGTLVVVKQ